MRAYSLRAVLTSLSPKRATAKDIAQALRDHWTVGNGIFRVRDVGYDEDGLHGRKIARGLSSFRDVAINIIRHEGYPFVPDGCRRFRAQADLQSPETSTL